MEVVVATWTMATNKVQIFTKYLHFEIGPRSKEARHSDHLHTYGRQPKATATCKAVYMKVAMLQGNESTDAPLCGRQQVLN